MPALRRKSMALTRVSGVLAHRAWRRPARDHHARRPGAARQSAVAAHCARAGARARACSRRCRRAAWCATGAHRTSSASLRCRSTTASRTCCAVPGSCARCCSRRADPLMPTYTIIGAGPVGTLMGLMLARRGQRVRLIERRADPRLAAAGTRPLDQPGAGGAWPYGARTCRCAPAHRAADDRRCPDACCTMSTRRCSSCPTARIEHEVIHAISRERLNRTLIEAAAELSADRARASTPAASTSIPQAGTLQLRDEHGAGTRSESFEILLGADGAGSAVRAALVARAGSRARGAATGARLQGAADSAGRERRRCALCVRAARTAHLAARRLHADRTAQHRLQLHRHAVPGTCRRSRLRSPEGRRGGAGLLPAPVRRRRGGDAGPCAAVRAAPAGAARHRVLPRLAGRGPRAAAG